VAWISFGTQAQVAKGKISFPKKPFSVEGCSIEQLSRLNASHIAAAVHLEYATCIFFTAYGQLRICYFSNI